MRADQRAYRSVIRVLRKQKEKVKMYGEEANPGHHNECPYCEQEIEHFDDVEGPGPHDDLDCPHCDMPLSVELEYSVDYWIKKREAQESQ